MQNNLPMEYNDLRVYIHEILYDLLSREIQCHEDNEFDYEYMESITDQILRLIKQQGGTY